MFGINDIPKFFLAFFLVLPIISLLHEAGHVFFAWLMGGRNIKVQIGSGKPIFKYGMLEVRQYYFWYGLCSFDNLKRRKKISNILIFFGGSLFNGLATILVMFLVENKMMEGGMVTYQFTYFSLYYIFFALLPMPYPDGNYSDGKIILDLLRNDKDVLEEKIYRIKWQKKEEKWHVLKPDGSFVDSYKEEKEAFEKAQQVASEDRPSRILNSKDDEEEEIHHFPRIPL